MGRSAKLHKRVPKKTKSSSTSSSTQPAQNEQLQNAKMKASLKDKAKVGSALSTRKEGEHVLGGADYVSLMMGGRKKARKEATKLPRDE